MSCNQIRCRETGEALAYKLGGGVCVCVHGECRERGLRGAYAVAAQRVENAAPADRPFIAAEEFWGNTIKQMESWKRNLKG